MFILPASRQTFQTEQNVNIWLYITCKNTLNKAIKKFENKGWENRYKTNANKTKEYLT